jgi:hypothetical protein
MQGLAQISDLIDLLRGDLFAHAICSIWIGSRAGDATWLKSDLTSLLVMGLRESAREAGLPPGKPFVRSTQIGRTNGDLMEPIAS